MPPCARRSRDHAIPDVVCVVDDIFVPYINLTMNAKNTPDTIAVDQIIASVLCTPYPCQST